MFLRAINTSETRAVTSIAVKLMALTFVRTSELMGAELHEIDLEAKKWRITAERMKMKSPHIVPLATQALDLLTTLKEITGWSLYLFPREHDPKKPWVTTLSCKPLNAWVIKAKWQATALEALPARYCMSRLYTEHIELQLAHAPRNAVSAAYNHPLYLQPLTVMMQQLADYLGELKAGAKVIPLHGKSA